MKSEEKKMNVIIYVRVSTKDQALNFSLDSQERICRKYAESQNWNVLEVFREEGESAKTANRPMLLHIIEYCRRNKGKVDIFLVYKFDRFARNSADHHTVKAILKSCNVTLKSATEILDESPGGKFMETIYSATAQLDNDVRSDRTKEGMREKVRHGIWSWKAPIGYKNVSAGIIFDKDKAPIIKKAFQIYSQGQFSVTAMTKKVNAWGLRTEKGKKITPQCMSKIFKNKLYMGILCVWGEEFEGIHEQLVRKDVFYKVNTVRTSKSVHIAVKHFRDNPLFPLKNILICENCGKNLSGSSSKGRNRKHPYYHCTCGRVRIPKHKLDDMFYKLLKIIQPDNELIEYFKSTLLRIYKQKHEESSKELSKIDKAILNLKELKQKLLQKNLNNILSDDEYLENAQMINERIALKEIERAECRENETSVDLLIKVLESLFENVAGLWFESKFEDKLRFQRLLFPYGIPISNTGFGTTTLACPFNLIGQVGDGKDTLVNIVSSEWNTLVSYLEEVYSK